MDLSIDLSVDFKQNNEEFIGLLLKCLNKCIHILGHEFAGQEQTSHGFV